MRGLRMRNAWVIPCLVVTCLGAGSPSHARDMARADSPTVDQCRQQFARSPAAGMCSASVNVTVPEPGVCSIQATCRTGRGSVSKTGARAVYPEGVRELVNCNGSLRHKRC